MIFNRFATLNPLVSQLLLFITFGTYLFLKLEKNLIVIKARLDCPFLYKNNRYSCYVLLKIYFVLIKSDLSDIIGLSNLGGDPEP